MLVTSLENFGAGPGTLDPCRDINEMVAWPIPEFF